LTSAVLDSSTVRLTFEVPYLSFHSFEADLVFVWEVKGVRAIAVGDVDGKESETLEGLASRLPIEDFEIVDAEGSEGPPAAISVSGLFVDSGEFYVIGIQGDALTVTRSDGAPATLSGMLALGDAYWTRRQNSQ
jgi:hypothetical protein